MAAQFAPQAHAPSRLRTLYLPPITAAAFRAQIILPNRTKILAPSRCLPLAVSEPLPPFRAFCAAQRGRLPQTPHPFPLRQGSHPSSPSQRTAHLEASKSAPTNVKLLPCKYESLYVLLNLSMPSRSPFSPRSCPSHLRLPGTPHTHTKFTTTLHPHRETRQRAKNPAAARARAGPRTHTLLCSRLPTPLNSKSRCSYPAPRGRTVPGLCPAPLPALQLSQGARRSSRRPPAPFLSPDTFPQICPNFGWQTQKIRSRARCIHTYPAALLGLAP